MNNIINHINLVGRVGSEPETRYGENYVLCNLSIAVKRPTKEPKTDWFKVELWGQTAETAANYVQKGSLIGIEGYIKFDEWQDKNTGESRSKLVVRGDRLHLLGSKPSADNSTANSDTTDAKNTNIDDDDF